MAEGERLMAVDLVENVVKVFGNFWLFLLSMMGLMTYWGMKANLSYEVLIVFLLGFAFAFSLLYSQIWLAIAIIVGVILFLVPWNRVFGR